ncbi:MAG TPA: PKD domain-containing protein, partial [Bacteroidia bacterium]|nr:PKD domain-containing protein [Bacteroidia bacterium]
VFDAGPGFYSYKWFDGNTNQTNTVYGAGKYWVTVTDSCGGTQSDTVLVTLAPPPFLDVRPDTALCSNDSVLLSFTPVGVYSTYQWTPTLGLNCVHCPNPNAKPVVTTKYYLLATNSDGCTAMDSITITVASSPTLTASNYTTCAGQIINITPTVIGGTGFYVYNWAGLFTGTSYSTTPKSDSSYMVSVTDTGDGCFTPFFTGNITVLQPLKVNVNGTSACVSIDTISLLATVSGGTGNYTYNWLPPNTHQNPLLVQPLTTTIYTVIVSDGCSTNAVDTAQVIITPAPLISLPNSISGCKPVCIYFNNIPYNNLTVWKWDFGDGSTSGVQKPFHCYNNQGNYNISFSYTTASGCIKTVSSNNIVTVYPSPSAAFSASTFDTDIFDDDIYFYNESSGYTNIQWSFGDLTGSNLTNPSHLYTSLGNYLVTLIVQNQNGCSDTSIREVIVHDVFTFYAPNTFSPNEDIYNEKFLPIGTGWDNSSFKMLVFDRWGNQVLSTTNPNQGWDGKMKGNDAPEDVYVWKVELKDIFNKGHSYSGTITLIR